jgi:hypothetical protein
LTRRDEEDRLFPTEVEVLEKGKEKLERVRVDFSC